MASPDHVLAKPGEPSWHFVANADLSANVYRFVKAGASEGLVAANAAATDRPVAAQQDEAASAAGLTGQFISTGVVRMIAGAAITAFARVGTDSQGRVIPLVAGSFDCGYALTAAGVAGEHVSVFIDLVNPTVSAGSSGFAAGVAAGYKIARGQATTVAASDTIATGLATVISAVANLEDAPVIGCDRAQAVIGDQAGTPAAGSILIKTFKPTASGDATPVAATTFTKKVNWIAIGT